MNYTYTYSTDADLLAQFRQDKAKAFDSFYTKYWHRLLHFSMKYLDDLEAGEDLVQELLLRFYTEECYLKIKTSLSSYLHKALKNSILNYLRKQAIYKRHLLLYGHGSANTIENTDKKAYASCFEKNMHLLLKKMPEKYREVYALRYKHELTIKKISVILNRPVDTVDKQSRKITWFLRDNLKTVVQ